MTLHSSTIDVQTPDGAADAYLTRPDDAAGDDRLLVRPAPLG